MAAQPQQCSVSGAPAFAGAALSLMACRAEEPSAAGGHLLEIPRTTIEAINEMLAKHRADIETTTGATAHVIWLNGPCLLGTASH